MTYYAQKKSIKNGQPVTPNNRYGSYDDMLYQFFLYCANSVKNNDENDYDSVEFGTIERGVIKKEHFNHPAPAPEPEPEEEPTPEPEPEQPGE